MPDPLITLDRYNVVLPPRISPAAIRYNRMIRNQSRADIATAISYPGFSISPSAVQSWEDCSCPSANAALGMAKLWGGIDTLIKWHGDAVCFLSYGPYLAFHTQAGHVFHHHLRHCSITPTPADVRVALSSPWHMSFCFRHAAKLDIDHDIQQFADPDGVHLNW